MKISKTHQEFAVELETPRALEHPEEFLGKNWKDVLNFWFFLDTLTIEQWKSIRDAYYSLSSDERQLAAGDARVAARAAVGDAGVGAWFAAACCVQTAAGHATYELIGSHILKEQGKSFVILQLFLNP